MAYDPFARGPHPVGVRTLDLSDASRAGRSLPTEVWYPATDVHAGQDVDESTCDHYELLPGLPGLAQQAVRDAAPREGRRPLVVFSHGYGGHRRQSTFLCTHLASHGWTVAAPDHTGNTVLDVAMALVTVSTGGTLPDVTEEVARHAAARPADMVFVIDRLVGGVGGLEIDAEQIGIAGHSFGGWTVLNTITRERRVRAVVALAPAGGATDLPINPLLGTVDFAWGRTVPALYVVAERDTILPLRGMHELFERTAEPRLMVTLQNADHLHFCDRVEEMHEMFRLMPQDRVFEVVRERIPPMAELCPGEPALRALRGVALAHLEAHVRGRGAAGTWLAGDLEAALAPQAARVLRSGRASAQASA